VRLAEERRGAAPAPRPLVRGEESNEEEAEEEAALSPPIVGQSVSDAGNQCQQVLSHFSAEEGFEAQGSDQCIQRIAELKAKWGNDCDVTALWLDMPEVQRYGRWWSDIYRGKDGVWRLRKTLLAEVETRREAATTFRARRLAGKRLAMRARA
jgi:hypothetical protein